MANKKPIDLLQILIEIGIITIGILIAYQLNSWNDSKRVHESEISILKEIKSNLELDLSDMAGNQRAHSNGIVLIDSLNLLAQQKQYDTKIPFYIFRIFRDLLFIPQTSAFETLKSRGVDLITSDSLRIRILRLYDFQYDALSKMENEYAPGQFQEDFRYLVETYFLNFDVNNFENIVPRYKNSSWLGNPDVRIRLDLARKERLFYNDSYLMVIAEAKSLIQAIDQELNK